MPDLDGYPTKGELELILAFRGTPHEFFDYICSIWWYDSYAVTRGRDAISGGVKRINISTVGWSGNEDIIGVLKQTWFWFMWWQQSNRGGHYMFEVPTKLWDKPVAFEQYGLPHSKVE